MGNMDRLCRYVIYTVDKIVLSKPRIFGVGFILYMMIILVYWIGKIEDYILNISELLIIEQFIGTLSTTLVAIGGVAYIGSSLVKQLDYVNYNGKYIRRIAHNMKEIMDLLIANNESIPLYGRRSTCGGFVLALVMPQVIYITYYLTFIKGRIIMELLKEGARFGFIVLSIDFINQIMLTLIWISIVISLVYVLWIHKFTLDRISHAIEKELKGINNLKLDNILKNILKSDRPVLEFLRFRRKLNSITEVLNLLTKKILFLLIIFIVWVMFINYTVGIDFWVMVIIITDLILISFVIGFTIYNIYKWSSELSRLIIVEIKNIKLSLYKKNQDQTITKTTEELELLMKELKHSIISSRELWELIAGLLTLIASILTLIISSL